MTLQSIISNTNINGAKLIIGLLCFNIIFSTTPTIAETELSGSTSIEYRYFHNDSLTKQNNYHHNLSLAIAPRFFYDWEESHQNILFSPFLRIDEHDAERTHADIRELVWQGYQGDWSWRAGIGKVFWGVTESQHLVDIINQTDLIEHFDGEDKLGQPMININIYRDWGALELFMLPYFRERTLQGPNGRLRVDIDNYITAYESAAERHHIDWALRWTHSFGFWDVAISHFYGTSREPEVILNDDVFTIYYGIMHQTGIEVQYTYDAWLWKWESIRRETEDETLSAFTTGFEYTFYSVADSVADVGILVEYLFDDRDDATITAFEDDIFAGVRITGNDAKLSELLIGISHDLTKADSGYRIEASTSFSDRWKVTLEGQLLNIKSEESILYSVRKDDFVQLTISRFF